jgi:type 1 glutamine amidotransferase
MMRHMINLALWLAATAAFAAEKTQNPWDPNYVVSEDTARAIEAAMPERPFAAPARPRKLLIYGRKPTHPMSVACCFDAIEMLGRKTGAFETVASGDPLVFMPDNLARFDAVLMNNTHEQSPMLPLDFDQLSGDAKAAAKEREAMLQKSLFDFVAGGKGIVGIHAAVATGWKDYTDMMGGHFDGHVTGQVWVKPNEPAHPLCAPLNERSFQVLDEIYVSTAPGFGEGLRVLLSLDLEKTPDPGRRDDGDYIVSWVRPYGEGRVFYCSLGHEASSYYNPRVLEHYLAGIQFALGDLEADATPRQRKADKPAPTVALEERRNGHITAIPPESPEDRDARHRKIAGRRSGPVVIVHRGAWAFAPENTLEACAAAMDHGADGCEIDIRRTADGVLVLFHDDGLDRMTDALGRVNQHTYAELLAVEFRSGYRAKPDTRIPTLAAVLELARQRAMLLHLDVKEAGLEEEIAKLLDAADAWDHVVHINEWNATALRDNPKVHPLSYKASGLQEGRMDMDPDKVRESLARPGHMIMVDDPRVAARELSRQTLRVPLPDHLRAPLPLNLATAAASQIHPGSFSPAAYRRSLTKRVDTQSLDELGELLAADFPDRANLEGDAPLQQRRALRILERAWAAEKIGQLGERSARAVKLLKALAAHRSLHPDWAYHGLDGVMAVRALGALGATESVPFLVKTFLTVDPELKNLVKPPANYPYAWADHQMKREILCVLGELPAEPSGKFLREYVAMDEATARRFAMPLFEEATQALLRQELTPAELQDLLRSTNSAVRGTAILWCLDDQSRGRASALRQIVPWTQELPPAER